MGWGPDLFSYGLGQGFDPVKVEQHQRKQYRSGRSRQGVENETDHWCNQHELTQAPAVQHTGLA
jgi:hypothetical protein